MSIVESDDVLVREGDLIVRNLTKRAISLDDHSRSLSDKGDNNFLPWVDYQRIRPVLAALLHVL